MKPYDRLIELRFKQWEIANGAHISDEHRDYLRKRAPQDAGDAALGDTVEFDAVDPTGFTPHERRMIEEWDGKEPVETVDPDNVRLIFPKNLHLRDPAELGWDRDPEPPMAA